MCLSSATCHLSFHTDKNRLPFTVKVAALNMLQAPNVFVCVVSMLLECPVPIFGRLSSVSFMLAKILRHWLPRLMIERLSEPHFYLLALFFCWSGKMCLSSVTCHLSFLLTKTVCHSLPRLSLEHFASAPFLFVCVVSICCQNDKFCLSSITCLLSVSC